MSLVKSGQAVAPTFTVTDPAGTGLINADSLPTGTVYVNGVADAAVVTVTNLTTGKYKSSVTLPALAAGDTVEIMISAVVGGVNFAETVWSAIGDTVRLSDISAKTDNLPTDPADQSQVEAAITAAQGTLTTAIGSLNDLSPAQVSAIVAAGDDATLAAIAALNNLSSAQAQAAATAALSAYPVPQIADIEAAIAAGSGATPETFWNYVGPGGRTLSQSMIAILSSMIEGSAITITRGDNVSVSITGLGTLAGRTGLWFTVKANPSKETDLQARIQITEDDGLVRLNGAAADDPADGSITVDDEANGDITIALAASASAALARTTSWHWDVQVAQPGPGIWTPRAGSFTVTADVTRAT